MSSVSRMETPTAILFVRPDRILELRLKAGAFIDLESVEAIIEGIDKIAEEPVLLLCILGEIEGTTIEVRNYVKESAVLRRCIRRTALVARSPVARIIANVYWQITKPITPTKMFANESRALNWLLAGVPQSVPFDSEISQEIPDENEMLTAMKEIMRGNYAYRLAVTDVNDPSDAIRLAINMTAEELSAKTEALERAKELLESRVKERTIELATVNLNLRTEIGEREKAERTLLETSRTLQETNRQLTQAIQLANQLAKKAEQANQVKSDFVAWVSHEMRTPLNAMINLPEIMLESFSEHDVIRCGSCGALYTLDTGEALESSSACPDCKAQGCFQADRIVHFSGDPRAIREFIGVISKVSKHLYSMVEEILEHRKTETGTIKLQLEALSLAAVVQEVVESIATLASSRDITISCDGFTPETLVKADRVKLAQIFYNLLGNAIKFSPSRSTIEVVSQVNEGCLLVSIRDQGKGIAQEHLEMIFESYRQVEDASGAHHGGTGLGLAITKNLVELHGGRIWVQSELGQGSTFYVEFPCEAAACSISRQ